jgi:hypothetical protein
MNRALTSRRSGLLRWLRFLLLVWAPRRPAPLTRPSRSHLKG